MRELSYFGETIPAEGGWGCPRACSIIQGSMNNNLTAPQIRFWGVVGPAGSSLSVWPNTWTLGFSLNWMFFSNSLQIKHEGLDDVSHFGDWKESKKRPWTLAMLRFCWNNIRFTVTYSMGLNIDFQIIWNAVFINNYWQGKALFLEALVCTVRLYFFLFWSAARLLKNAVQETSAVN